MRYFVLFEDDGDSLIKKIAGYHQFHGVREAVRERRATYGPAASALPLTKNEVQPGSRKAGVFWHTQGSGKSISMCSYAGKLLHRFLSGKALAAGSLRLVRCCYVERIQRTDNAFHHMDHVWFMATG